MLFPDDVWGLILEYRSELRCRDYMRYVLARDIRMAARRARYRKLYVAVPWPASMPDGWPHPDIATSADFDTMDRTVKQWKKLCQML